MTETAESALEVLAEAALAWNPDDAPPAERLQQARAALGPHAAGHLRALRDAQSLATAALVADRAPPAPLLARLQRAGHAICDQNARRRQPPPRWLPFAAFGLGAAAGLGAALLALLPTALPLPAAVHDELLLQGATQVTWRPGPSHAHGAVHGDVVWHGGRQQGCLRIGGLQPLPQDRQYQLWIVDGTRQGAPVDGGRFDLATPDDQFVPIHAHLPIGAAQAFVVTVEPRGGVVVSDQKDVVALAGP